MPTPDAPAEPSGTRRALIEAGMQLFARQGYAATTTRQIAARAGTNMASIGYHFGGKDGLRLACADEFVRRLRQTLDPALSHAPATPETAAARLREVVIRMVRFLTTAPEAADMAGFMLREVAQEGTPLEHIQAALIDPVHRMLCEHWAMASGQRAESPAVRLAVFALIGQIVYFRIGRPIVTRRMGWDGIGPDEADQIVDVLLRNLAAALAAGDPA